jgi:signal transduction histidine kinase
VLDGVYEPTPAHIEATLEETRLLARLVEDLQTLSLAEAGALPLRNEPVDPAALLADVQTSFSGQAAAAGVALRVEVGETPAFQADADRLNQVLSVLVANGLRHTPAGGQIILRAEATAAEIVLRVADSGEGIPVDQAPFVFDRFYRGDSARRREPAGGSGLGLAIARQLVMAHGGRIGVESVEGEGTTFTVALPREQ